MKQSMILCAAALSLGAAACKPAAQDGTLLDLKGRWVGTSESIVRGSAPHHAAAPGPAPLVDNVEFTLVITGQDGRRFWGTVSGGTSVEPVIGVIALDGKTIVARDSDGLLEGTIVDADTIDSVYSHNNGTSAVAASNRWKRQK